MRLLQAGLDELDRHEASVQAAWEALQAAKASTDDVQDAEELAIARSELASASKLYAESVRQVAHDARNLSSVCETFVKSYRPAW